MICAVFLNITFRTNTQRSQSLVRVLDGRVLGERETMDNDSSLPTILLLSRLAPAQRTGRYTLYFSGSRVLVLLLVHCLLLL